MNLSISVNQKQLKDILLNVATVRPVFIWGAPGIGKSSIVEEFALELGLECVSLLGSQLAPEDIIGVPQIKDGKSVFCPPKAIAKDEPYCLFLDELNACSHEVQKAFYSLILERRIGEYHLPEGSIVIGAGNRAHDNAITKQLSSALVNRMFHVELRADSRIWLEWAGLHGIHRYVYDYICARPDHLWSQPPKTEEPFSTPRSWHMLSDALHSYGDGITEEKLSILAYGSLTPAHALDDYYRRAIARGLEYHQMNARGSLPLGLIEEIHALSQKPIPWDVQLAIWFDEQFAPLEPRHSYARLSRRQTATPDIPRPAWITPEEQTANRIFAVLLDTSGSMDRHLLAQALGAISSYAESNRCATFGWFSAMHIPTIRGFCRLRIWPVPSVSRDGEVLSFNRELICLIMTNRFLEMHRC